MKNVVFHLLLAIGITCLVSDPAVAQIKVEKKIVREKSAGDGAWLGVMLKDVTTSVKDEKDLSADKGALVTDVVDDSPADSAGIQENDVIISFAGTDIDDSEALVSAVRKAKPGSKASVGIMRGKEKRVLPVRLGKPKTEMVIERSLGIPVAPPAPGSPLAFVYESGRGVYGLRLLPLEEQLAEYFGAPDKKGVLVSHVEKDSRGEKAGFKAGDVITKAGKKTIKDIEDFRAVLRAFDKGEMIPVEVVRKGSKTSIMLEAADEEPVGNSVFRFRGGPGQLMWNSAPGTILESEDDDVDVDVRVDTEELGSNLEELLKNVPHMQKDYLKSLEEMQLALPKAHKRIRIKTSVSDSQDI